MQGRRIGFRLSVFVKNRRPAGRLHSTLKPKQTNTIAERSQSPKISGNPLFGSCLRTAAVVLFPLNYGEKLKEVADGRLRY